MLLSAQPLVTLDTQAAQGALRRLIFCASFAIIPVCTPIATSTMSLQGLCKSSAAGEQSRCALMDSGGGVAAVGACRRPALMDSGIVVAAARTQRSTAQLEDLDVVVAK
jgi:hypothetical protein